MVLVPQTCPGEACTAKEMHTYSYNEQKTPTFQKETKKKKEKKKANEQKQKRTLAGARTRVLTTQSHTQAIWTGGLFHLFFLRKKEYITRGICTRNTRHAARPNLGDHVPQNGP